MTSTVDHMTTVPLDSKNNPAASLPSSSMPSPAIPAASLPQMASHKHGNSNNDGGDGKHFANSFWGPDDSKGVDAILTRMKQAKLQSVELHDMLKERAAMEDDHAKRMSRLAKSFNTSHELATTLRDALDTLRTGLEVSARGHLDLANEIRVQLEKPMLEFITTQNTVRKTHKKVLERHMAAKHAQEAAVLRAKERYESKSLEVLQINNFLKQGTVNSRESEKLRSKLDKLGSQVKQADAEYQAGIEKLGDLHRNWVADMTTACDAFERMEEDRFQFTRGILWNYTNFVSAFCVSEDEGSESVRQGLEKCDFGGDMDTVLSKIGTGDEVPGVWRYIPFSEATYLQQQMEQQQHQMDGSGTGYSSYTKPSGIMGTATAFFQNARTSITSTMIGSMSPSSAADNSMDRRTSTTTGTSVASIDGAMVMKKRMSFGTPVTADDVLSRASVMQSVPENGMSSPVPAAGGRASATTAATGGGSRLSQPNRPPPTPLQIQQQSSATQGVMPLKKSLEALTITSSSSSISNDPSKEQQQSIPYDPFDLPDTLTIRFTVKALYDYQTSVPEELSLVKGQLVPVLVDHADGWWEGVVVENGRRRKGLFPSNYTEKLV